MICDEPVSIARYHDIERIRRQRLVYILSLTFAILQGIIVIYSISIFIKESHLSPLVSISLVGNIIALGMFLASFWAAHEERLHIATTMLLVGAEVAICVTSLGWLIFDEMGPAVIAIIAACNLVIVAATAITLNSRITIITTIAINIITILMLSLAPHGMPSDDAHAINTHLGLLIPLTLIIQWLFALIVIATIHVYYSTFKKLDEVEEAYTRIQKIDEIKDQFISSVNHELRNPVMVINGYLEIMQQDFNNITPEKLKGMIDRAKTVGDDLRQLINSILEVGSIEQMAQDVLPRPVNVAEAFDTAQRLLAPSASQLTDRTFSITIADDLFIMGDKLRLQQILLNLLSNACKYSSSDKPIEIEARRLTSDNVPKGQPPGVEITVRDYGLGIPPGQSSYLFQRFVRLPRDLASTVSGNGLGLYLCRIFTEAMGGKIWVESTGIPDEGSKFYLRLPLATTADPTTSDSKPLTA
jgi:signal transduction histidine kinase